MQILDSEIRARRSFGRRSAAALASTLMLSMCGCGDSSAEKATSPTISLRHPHVISTVVSICGTTRAPLRGHYIVSASSEELCNLAKGSVPRLTRGLIRVPSRGFRCSITHDERKPGVCWHGNGEV